MAIIIAFENSGYKKVGKPLDFGSCVIIGLMVERIKVLRQSLIFSRLSEPELEELAKLAVAREFDAEEYVFWEEDLPDRFYIVAAGRIKVLKSTSGGKELIIAFFGPGEIFGEVAVFSGKPYPASAQAMENTVVLSISKDAFLKFLAAHPQVSLRIINVLGERLREAQSRIRDLAGERVEQRISRILLMLAAKLGPDLPFTRQEIADMSGTTVETAIRVMSRLKDGGIIRSSRGKTIIINETKLRLLSEGPPRV